MANKYFAVISVACCLLLMLGVLTAKATPSVTLIKDCVNHCIKEKKGSQVHCEVYCHNGHRDPRRLEIFVDNVQVNGEELEALSDATMNLSPLRFDRAVFNTPSAFEELVNWTDMLKQQVATAAERIFGGPFHMLSVPIPLSPSQIDNEAFMNRIVDVVPDSNVVFKETGPITFSEAYREFLLDLQVDAKSLNSGAKTPEALAKIAQLEKLIEDHLNKFIDNGDKCFMSYETHLVKNNLLRSVYSFDTFGQSSQVCKQADAHMERHEHYSKVLSDFLTSLNPFDEVFKSIAIAASTDPDWETNIAQIKAFASREIANESRGASPNAYRVALDMIRYYLKTEYFGVAQRTEESCINANVQMSAKGWTTVNVSPKSWFNSAVVSKYVNHSTLSKKNYFNAGGILQRQITQLVVAYKPVLQFTVGKAMKDKFISESSKHNYRAVEFGPMVFDKVDFFERSEVGTLDTYTMVLSVNSRDPQVIGFKTKSFRPIQIPKVSTDGWAFCKRQAACSMNRQPLAALHRYYRVLWGNPRYFYTINPNSEHLSGFRHEGVQAYCSRAQHPGTVPLYRYYNSRVIAHYFTVDFNILGEGKDGWKFEGKACFVYPPSNHAPGTTALHRYFRPSHGTHFWTTNWSELGAGRDGYEYKGVAAYVFTKDHIDQAISCCTCS